LGGWLNKRRALAIGLALAALAAGVGIYLVLSGWLLGVTVRACIKSIQHRWGPVNETTTIVVSTVVIHNPAPSSATLRELSYKIYLNGVEFAQGKNTEALEIPAGGDARLELITAIQNSKIPTWWVSHVRAGERTEARIEGSATVEAVGQTLTVPFSHTETFETDLEEQMDIDEPFDIVLVSLPLVGDIKITVKKVETSWGEVTDAYTQLVHEAHIYNPNDFSIPATSMRYVVTANGVHIAEGEQPLDVVLGPRTITTIRFYTYIDNSRLIDWWVTHVQHNETTHVAARIYATWEFTVPFVGPISVEVLVYKTDFYVKTDILASLSFP